MNVIVIHGSYGKPFENWFPWLENELTKLEINCTIPTFPTPNHQEYQDWARLLDYYADTEILNRDTILIGHSCGAVCAAKYLEDRNVNVKGLITVSGYNNYLGEDDHINGLNSTFYDEDHNLKRAAALAKERYSFISNNDPYITYEVLCDFAKLLNSKLIEIPEGGHFNSNAGYTEFPSILDIIKSI